MATTLIAIDPVTRLEGHLKVEVAIDNGRVTEARTTGTLFRGFEMLLINRDPWDAPHITQRICGVCPIPHGQAAVLALDGAARKTEPNNARILRNLVLAANFIQSHILHFYHLAALDYLSGPAMAPWQPQWAVDQRFDAATTAALIEHYKMALTMTRKAHEMGAIFGGRMPISPAYIPGGFTETPTATQIQQFKSYLNELISFINGTYIPDAGALSSVYRDYHSIGRGYGNLLAFGVFELDQAHATLLMRRGRVVGGETNVQPVDTNAITEQVKYSWYADNTTQLNPSRGVTTPVYPKTNGYSWLKAPRYQGQPYETGPLARMWVNSEYAHGISVMDRHWARAHETLKIAKAAQQWVNQLAVGQPVYSPYTTPSSANSVGLTAAPRGALGHWLQIANRKIARYQVITPTCWNASPRDDSGVRGPLEQALIGTPIQDAKQPIEVLRVIHSFDPCLSCAVHTLRPKRDVTIVSPGLPKTPVMAD